MSSSGPPAVEPLLSRVRRWILAFASEPLWPLFADRPVVQRALDDVVLPDYEDELKEAEPPRGDGEPQVPPPPPFAAPFAAPYPAPYSHPYAAAPYPASYAASYAATPFPPPFPPPFAAHYLAPYPAPYSHPYAAAPYPAPYAAPYAAAPFVAPYPAHYPAHYLAPYPAPYSHSYAAASYSAHYLAPYPAPYSHPYAAAPYAAAPYAAPYAAAPYAYAFAAFADLNADPHADPHAELNADPHADLNAVPHDGDDDMNDEINRMLQRYRLGLPDEEEDSDIDVVGEFALQVPLLDIEDIGPVLPEDSFEELLDADVLESPSTSGLDSSAKRRRDESDGEESAAKRAR
ncbi:uncharacterized protein LOC120821079 [Gasterosteus aculeatus]